MKKILMFLAVAGFMFAQATDSINTSGSNATSVGRNRMVAEAGSNGSEQRLPGQHNLVRQVQRRPTGNCSASEAQVDTDALEHVVPVEGVKIVDTKCWKVISQSYSYNLVTNAGLNWLADIMSNTSTPSVNTQCNYIGLSNGAGTPAAADTTLATTVGTEITTNGLGRAQATYAHTSNATTYTLAKTFTASGAQAAQAGAVFTAVSAGTMCFEDTFTSATLATNDTLTTTWTVTI